MISAPGSPRPATGTLFALGVILAVAAFLRLFALETPQLLHDEALVANAALYDLGYILRRALHSDAHPPYFYWLAKLYLSAGSSEGALRIVSALSGIFAVLALYKLGSRIAGFATGLISSSLLAVHLLHIELSRVLRPHSLTILLTIISTQFFFDFLEKPERKSLARLTLINLCLLVLHFNTALIIGAQMASILFLMVRGRIRPKCGLSFLAACALLLPVNIWFVAMRLGKFEAVDIGGSMSWTFMRTLANFDSLLTLAPLPFANMLGWLLVAAGITALYRRERQQTLLLSSLTLLPPLALILARYGIIYEPWHLAFLIPFLMFFCGYALSLIPIPARVFAPMVALIFGAAVWIVKHDAVYEPSSGMFNHNLGQRDISKALPPFMKEGAAVAFSNPEMRDFTNWYVRRFSTSDLNHFRLQNNSPAALTLVSAPGPVAHNSAGARLASTLGAPQHFVELPSWTLRHWDIKRTPVLDATRLPLLASLPANIENILANASSAQDISPILSPLGDYITPSRYDLPATLTYRIENRADRPAVGAELRFILGGINIGNFFSVALSFDGEELKETFSVSKVIQGGEVVVKIVEPKSFTSLDIACTMSCASVAPSFNNLPDCLAYSGMDVRVDHRDESFSSNVALIEAGLNAPEEGPLGRFRWGTGPESQLFFVPKEQGKYTLTLTGKSPLPGQAVEVLLDGTSLGMAEFPSADEAVSSTFSFTAAPGNRLLTLRYRLFNHGPGGEFAPDDGRHLALAYSTLKLQSEIPGRSTLVYLKEQE